MTFEKLAPKPTSPSFCLEVRLGFNLRQYKDKGQNVNQSRNSTEVVRVQKVDVLTCGTMRVSAREVGFQQAKAATRSLTRGLTRGTMRVAAKSVT